MVPFGKELHLSCIVPRTGLKSVDPLVGYSHSRHIQYQIMIETCQLQPCFASKRLMDLKWIIHPLDY